MSEYGRINGVPKASVFDIGRRQRALGNWVILPAKFESAHDLPCVWDLTRDTFWRLYTAGEGEEDGLPPNPRLSPNREINKRLMDWLETSNVLRDIRANCIGKLMTSEIASAQLAEQLMNIEDIAEAIMAQAEAEALEELANQIDNNESGGGASDGGESGDESGDGDSQQDGEQKDEQNSDGNSKPKPNDLRKQAEQKRQQASNAMDKMDNPQTKDQKNRATMAKTRALTNAQKNTEEKVDNVESWGMEDGAPEKIDREKISTLLNDKYADVVNRITPLMGRTKGIMVGARVEDKRRGFTLHDAGYTRNLANAFPSELAALSPLANPVLRATTAAKFADRGLVGMVEASVATKEGGLVIAVDESGSMDNMRYDVKALALGLLQAAIANEQPAHVFSFSNHVIRPAVDDTSTLAEQLDWAARWESGGTDFNAVLNEFVSYLLSIGDRAKSFDAVILTDGESNIDEKIAQKFEDVQKQYGVRLIVLGIDKNPMAQNNGLQKFSGCASAVVSRRDDMDAIAEKLSELIYRDGESQNG